jgi:hypothetical protein
LLPSPEEAMAGPAAVAQRLFVITLVLLRPRLLGLTGLQPGGDVVKVGLLLQVLGVLLPAAALFGLGGELAIIYGIHWARSRFRAQPPGTGSALGLAGP